MKQKQSPTNSYDLYVRSYAKIYKLMEAYNALIAVNKECENVCQNMAEYFTDCYTDSDYYTKNGESLTHLSHFIAVSAIYYYNYVNRNTGYYDFKEWIAKQESPEAIRDMIFKKNKFNTNSVRMLEAAGIVRYLVSCKNITCENMIETNAYVMDTGEVSAYTILLNCDGNKDLIGVFDKDMNMLNICSSDPEDKNVRPWYHKFHCLF